MEQYRDTIRTASFAAGCVLLAAGAFLLVYCGVTVYKMINQPESVGLVSYVMRELPGGDKAIYGTLGDKPFELMFTETARKPVSLLISVFVLAILAGILKELLSGGVKLVSYAMKKPEAESETLESMGPVRAD